MQIIIELQNITADEITRRMEKLESPNLAVRQLLIQAAARLKVTKQQMRLSGIQKSLAKLQSNS